LRHTLVLGIAVIAASGPRLADAAGCFFSVRDRQGHFRSAAYPLAAGAAFGHEFRRRSCAGGGLVDPGRSRSRRNLVAVLRRRRSMTAWAVALRVARALPHRLRRRASRFVTEAVGLGVGHELLAWSSSQRTSGKPATVAIGLSCSRCGPG
jgi:hypothetical protein